MSNTSATGGYLVPTSSTALPGGLTLAQFIQTILVGISGISGQLVRPKWQKNAPKQPDVDVNWIAFGIVEGKPDANAHVSLDASNINHSQRHQDLEIQCSFYGPDAMDVAGQLQDGFHIQQNLEAMRAGKMGFVSTGSAMHVPDLVNERWVNRIEMSVFLRREIQRSYPVLTLVSASGTVHTVLGTDQYVIDWQTKPEET